MSDCRSRRRGYARGDPIKLVYPTDSFGNVCGTGDYEDKKFLFFFDLLRCAQTGAAVVTMGCPTPQICVSECPTTYWTYAQTVYYETLAGSMVTAERAKMLCKYSVDPYSAAVSGDEREMHRERDEVINRCIPSIFAEITDLAADLVYVDGSKNFTVSDDGGNGITGSNLSDGSYGIVVAMAVCMLWIVLMRFIAGPMVWATIIGVFALVIFGEYIEFLHFKPSLMIDSNR
ncbi:choline transporter protein 2 [Elysia marginata]|uniref:Choline transporter protein 2 n=1 Tax=Elysia marginata TaxID=1093978 RepID=A0AAV4FDE8_9GAST|nr:choline transporter protein 2 [Elysia marginata]